MLAEPVVTKANYGSATIKKCLTDHLGPFPSLPWFLPFAAALPNAQVSTVSLECKKYQADTRV